MRQPEDVGFRHGWLFAPPGERPRMQVACIGSACVDRSYSVRGAVLGSSNPARRGPLLYGGVARNVCENLARLGVDTALVSAVGKDAAGNAMLDALKARGVNTQFVSVVDGATDEYAAILDDGELLVAAADMRAVEHLMVEDLAPFWVSSCAQWVFADANLPPEIARDIMKRRAGGAFLLALDAVSEPKAAQLPSRLDADVVFFNEGEARSYLRGDASAETCAAELLARGARAAVVMCGPSGVVCADESAVERIAARPAKRVCATGAGDALAAGTLWRLLAGDALCDAVRAGCELAALTLETESSVRPDLSPDLLASRMAAR